MNTKLFLQQKGLREKQTERRETHIEWLSRMYQRKQELAEGAAKTRFGKDGNFKSVLNPFGKKETKQEILDAKIAYNSI